MPWGEGGERERERRAEGRSNTGEIRRVALGCLVKERGAFASASPASPLV